MTLAPGRMRICEGAAHVEGCHHEVYMRHGVERFLAHPRTREALRLALSTPDHAVITPTDYAGRILLELYRVSERLDGIDEDCGTSDEQTEWIGDVP